MCNRRIDELQREIDTKLASAQRFENKFVIFIELREQAVRDKAAEVPNIERVERFYNELAEAPRKRKSTKQF